MTTYGELRDRVIWTITEDPSSLAEGSETLLFNAISAAHDAVLPWIPKTGIATLTAADVAAFNLPEDFYEVEACVLATGEVVPKSNLNPGSYVGEYTTGNNDWLLFPSGKITFSKVPTSDVTLYYLASWVKPSDETDDDYELDPPDYVMTGITLYAAAFTILPSAVSVTEISQWNTKVDSGNPEHNPVQKAADYLLKLFNSEMNRLPKYLRSQK